MKSASASWLSLTPSSGGTAPAPQASIRVDPASLASGHHSATITLGWSNARQTDQTATVTVPATGSKTQDFTFAAK